MLTELDHNYVVMKSSMLTILDHDIAVVKLPPLTTEVGP